MDTKRLILAAGLTIVILWLYQAWLEYQYPGYYQQQSVTKSSGNKQLANPQTHNDGPGKPNSSNTSKADGKKQSSAVPEAETYNQESGNRSGITTSGKESNPGVPLGNNRLKLVLDKDTGDPIRAELPQYHVRDDPDSPPVKVLSTHGNRLAIAQTGWISSEGPSASHDVPFKKMGEVKSIEGGDGQRIEFVHKKNGIIFKKEYILPENSYQVQVEYGVENTGSKDWNGHIYGQMRFRSGSEGSFFLYSFDGPVVFANDQMQTFSLASLTENKDAGFEARDPYGWGGVMDRYFLSTWVPNPQNENQIFARGTGGAAFSGFVSPFPEVAPGEKVQQRHQIFLGPKNQALLEKVGGEHHLRRAVDYGILSFLAIPLFEVMEFFHSIVGNYGVAIILVTLLIKIIFFPLFSMSYRAMANMKKVQPELQRIREQHGDDRQKMNEEMMRLYREEKVNPLGGCLPILVQIPVFISLYWVLLESVELRHQPFALWVQDLTSQDPFYILPVLMGASMVVQQMMNPAPMDPTQKKIMMGLPVVFTVFFTQFPAGLVLYWLSNNLISIGQQWWIMRKTA